MSEAINNDNHYEFSFKEVKENLYDFKNYFKNMWWKIFISGLIGGTIGLVYASRQPIFYTAKNSFIVEEGKANTGVNSLSSLAGQFGLDLGTNSGGGFISGDNIVYYFKSESLTREVLLSWWDSSKNKLFIERYLDAYKINGEWKDEKELRNINFKQAKERNFFSRKEDSVIQIISLKIINEEIKINRLDKKASILELSVKMENEELAKKYCDQLLKVAIDNYILLKTERQLRTVNKLQHRADSILELLNTKTKASAILQTSSIISDQNPVFKTPNIFDYERNNRDKIMLSGMYAEIVKNLELAKFTLSQETPVIQVLDKSLYPLLKNKTSKIKYTLFLMLLFSIISILFFVLERKLNDIKRYE